jgi:quercetin dioxygenase-like cupin family protein
MSVARLQDLARIDGEPTWTPVRHLLGIEAFGVNAWHGDRAGDLVIEEHDEEGLHQELYVVLAGRARFVVDGTEHDAPAGTFVAVEPAQTRTAHAAEDGTVVLALGATPGEAFSPSDWETKAIAEANL